MPATVSKLIPRLFSLILIFLLVRVVLVNASLSRSTIGGAGAGMSQLYPVLGGDGTKIAPSGDLFDATPGEMS